MSLSSNMTGLQALNATALRARPSIYTMTLQDEISERLATVNQLVLVPCVSLAGIIANIINIVVFIKLGFNDTMNITLLGMSVADFIISFLQFHIFVLNSKFYPSWLPVNFRSIAVVVVSTPIVWGCRVSNSITAFAALERFLCVLIPFKIKSLLTKRRQCGIIIGIFILMSGTVVAQFNTYRLGWKFSPRRNTSILTLIVAQDTFLFYNINNYIVSFFSTIIYLSGIVLTILLVVELKRKSLWRLKATSQPLAINAKEQALCKMIIVICTINIIFCSPKTFMMISITATSVFGSANRSRRLINSLGNLSLTFQTTNSALNTIVYWNMSTKYREKCMSLIRGSSVRRVM